MFCPSCKAEYRPGFYQCPDCGIELVHELPPEDPSDRTLTPEEDRQASLVKVYSTYSQTDVMLVKALLDAEEIPYHMQGELFHGSGIYLTPATLYVARSEADRVREMLEDHGLK